MLFYEPSGGEHAVKRSVWLWQLFGFAFVALGGTLLHFLYEWLGETWWIAPFSGVNESTWEHMKLLFWPMLIFALVQSLFFRDNKSFWCVKLRGILLGLLLIPLIFYAYNGIIGKSPDWVNIAIFFVAAAAAYIYEARELNSGKAKHCSERAVLSVLGAIAILFVAFTFLTPQIAIFRDPLTGGYGR